MKLYYLQGACSLAVHIVLEWIGQPYASQAVSREELKQAEFLALNPLGSAPVFTDGDLCLTQSSAILQYLADKYPKSQLLSQDLVERAQTLMWLGLINSDIHRHYGLLFGAPMYAQHESCQKELQSNAVRRLKQFYTVINQQLADKDYLVGKRSIADAYLYVTLRWAQRADIDLSDFEHLPRFFALLHQDDGVQAALAAEGLK